jgi:hypothetical protein
MIDFSCSRCRERYSVPSELAGSDMQCTKCGLLMAVPLPSEIGNLNDDGTIRVADSTVTQDPNLLQNMMQAFSKEGVDEFGEFIDKRTLAEDIELAPITGPVKRTVPQYDPETGELVRPIGVAPKVEPPIADIAPPDAPRTATVAIGYRPKGSAADEVRTIPPREVKLELFRPHNMLVIGIVALAHLEIIGDIGICNSGYLMLAIVPLALLLMLFTFFLLVGHYGNVIDEIAGEDRDELARPLRQMQWIEDIWRPFRTMLIPTVLAITPWIFALAPWADVDASLAVKGAASLIFLGAALLVSLIQPALILALHMSGSLRNLRFDRIGSVIKAGGREYLIVALIGFAATMFYMLGFIATGYSAARRFGGADSVIELKLFRFFPVNFMILLVGIYLAHLFHWRVALLYRLYHEKFAWVDQEHVSTRLKRPRKLSAEERAALREEKRRKAMRQQPHRRIAVESLPGRQMM